MLHIFFILFIYQVAALIASETHAVEYEKQRVQWMAKPDETITAHENAAEVKKRAEAQY